MVRIPKPPLVKGRWLGEAGTERSGARPYTYPEGLPKNQTASNACGPEYFYYAAGSASL